MKKNNKIEIPIMFCFDKNYVIPASVAFYSLLEHANKKYFYKFYVLHSDISNEQQEKLRETLKEFKEYYDLEFIDMKNKMADVWENVESKIHFSKEAMYKLIVASLFPQYDKIIVSDVDVVFLGDISPSYFAFDIEDDVYIAGVRQLGSLRKYNSVYKDAFSKKMIEKFNSLCAGYLVYNLKKIRTDNVEKKFFDFLDKNIKKIIYPEQDVLNAVTYGKMCYLPLNYVTCTYFWKVFLEKKDYKNDGVYKENEIIDAMENPIQLHYADAAKPWRYVDCIKSEIWYQYIVKTAFLRDFLESLPNTIVLPNQVSTPIPETPTSNPVKQSKLRRILGYIKRNPLFFLKKDFYKKLFNKLKRK